MEHIQRLRLLHKFATPAPWSTEAGAGYMPLMMGKTEIGRLDHTDIHLVIALRNLAPELIALWEAAKGEGKHQDGLLWIDGIDEALAKLNDKADAVLK